MQKSVEKLEFQNVLLEFWEERGEKLMICHLLLDNFLEISWPLGDFKGWEFWNGFLFQANSNIITLISWNVRLFWILSFVKDVLLQKFDCVFALAIRGLLHMTKNLLVVWFLYFNHFYGIFWKVSLKKSWCCRKHVFVFEIVSLKGLNKFWSNYLFFPLNVG